MCEHRDADDHFFSRRDHAHLACGDARHGGIQVVSKWLDHALDHALIVATLVLLWLVGGVAVSDGAGAADFAVPRAQEEASVANPVR